MGYFYFSIDNGRGEWDVDVVVVARETRSMGRFTVSTRGPPMLPTLHQFHQFNTSAISYMHILTIPIHLNTSFIIITVQKTIHFHSLAPEDRLRNALFFFLTSHATKRNLSTRPRFEGKDFFGA